VRIAFIPTKWRLDSTHGVQLFCSLYRINPVASIGRMKANFTNRCDDPVRPCDFIMCCNPQARINMARKRLCRKSHVDIWTFFDALRFALRASGNPMLMALGSCLVPDCEYRGSCHEFNSCKKEFQ
jgi:hypothetical protein